MKLFVVAPLAVGVCLWSLSPPSFSQSQVRDLVETQSATQAAAAAVQERINDLDDESREMLTEYRQAMSQIADLQAYNEQLEGLVATQNVELADFERRFQDIETTKRRILPLILRMVDVLEEAISVDTPFLPDERAMRIASLRELMARPDVPTSEKYRRVTEAYQIELEYGHTIESYEGELELDGDKLTVAFLRYGRLGLYFMTLDGQQIGMWDKTRSSWTLLDNRFRQSMDRAMRIARKQLPPDLTRLPVPAPENRS
ncbi:MAG: DUF3450 domain-containing protein [Pseudomonadota bacterium]